MHNEVSDVVIHQKMDSKNELAFWMSARPMCELYVLINTEDGFGVCEAISIVEMKKREPQSEGIFTAKRPSR